MRSRYRCSMCPAIHINSRSWLRSSSTHEPSDPPLRVILRYFQKRIRQASRKRLEIIKKIKNNVKNESQRKLGRSNSVESLNLAQIALVDGKGFTAEIGTQQNTCLRRKKCIRAIAEIDGSLSLRQIDTRTRTPVKRQLFPKQRITVAASNAYLPSFTPCDTRPAL